MPTYVLSGAGRAVFPSRKSIVVSMTLVGAPNAGATMWALVEGVEDARVIRPTPGLMFLPRVDAPTVVRLAPSGGRAEFPPGTTVHLSLTVEDRNDPDPDSAVIGPVDVSGLAHIDVAALESTADGIVVAALRGGREIELGPVANQARVATRAALGVDQLPESAQSDIAVVVDVSASMLPSFTDGSVSAAIDIVAGIASVVAPHRTIRACLAGAPPTWFDIAGLGSAADEISARFDSTALVLGFQSKSVVAPSTDTVMFVVTDGVPADDPGLASDDGRHILAITPSGEPTGLPSLTVIAPPPVGSDARERLSNDRARVNEVVRSILSATPLGGRGHTVVTR